MQSEYQQYTIIQKEQMDSRVVTLTTNNDTTTLMTSTMKSPLKCLHNKWRHLGHLQHPDEAIKDIFDFIKTLATHDVCYEKLTLENAGVDTSLLAVMQPMVLPMPGIQDIKWVELYDKFWLLILVEYRNERVKLIIVFVFVLFNCCGCCCYIIAKRYIHDFLFFFHGRSRGKSLTAIFSKLILANLA